jgi:hypothetical protein
MTPEITLGAIVLIPIAFLLILRVNATLVFLSLCLGSVLIQYVLGDANSFVSWLSTSSTAPKIHTSQDNIKLVLLLLPVVLTSVFMIRTVKGTSRLVLNALPAVGVGLLGALLVVPLLPPGLAHNIVRSDLWDQILKVQNIIVGGSAVVCLLVLWLQRPKTESKHHKKHKS